MSAVLLIAAVAALGIYACRTDPLSWWEHPFQMLGHVAGVCGAAWAMWQSGAAIEAAVRPGPDAVAALLASGAWLVASYWIRPQADDLRPSEWAKINADR